MSNQEMDFTDAQMLRMKAEEQLKKKQKKIDKPVMETDVKKLLHELQVHQIELEMQNEELRQAYETAETALKKYTMLYDFAPMGYFTLDSDGSICDLNFTGAEILGDKRVSLINSNFKLFVSENSKPVFNNFFRKVYAGNAKESCEVMLGYDNNPLCFVYLEGIVTGDDRKCLLSVVDISGFKKQNNP
jgi:PAS domain-containing protein